MKQLNSYIQEALVKKHLKPHDDEFVDMGTPGVLWCKHLYYGKDNEPKLFGWYQMMQCSEKEGIMFPSTANLKELIDVSRLEQYNDPDSNDTTFRLVSKITKNYITLPELANIFATDSASKSTYVNILATRYMDIRMVSRILCNAIEIKKY